MGYAGRKYKKQEEERPWNVHPIWRGIGCIFIILMPIIAWAAADLFMQTNQTFNLPPLLYQQVSIPLANWQPINVVISAIDELLSKMHLTYGIILFTLLFLIIGYGLLSIIYGIIYRLVGPPRYSKVDARPITIRRRRK